MSNYNYYCVPDATAGPSNLVGSTFTTDQFGVVTVTPIEWVDYWDGTYEWAEIILMSCER